MNGVRTKVRRMSVFKNGTFYHYEFVLNGKRRRGSTGTANKPRAIKEERRQRERLEKSYSQVIEEEARELEQKTIKEADDEFLIEYTLKHESATYAIYALRHVKKLLGSKLVVEITPTVVKRYQMNRLAQKAAPKSINDEVMLLLRLCGDQGDLIRVKLHREKSLKLKLPPSPGKAYTADEKARMLAEAAKLRSRNMYPALVVDLNCGLRGKELRELRWQQIDLVHKKHLTVGKSKNLARRRDRARYPVERHGADCPRGASPSRTPAASVGASRSGLSSLPEKASRMIRRARSRR